MKLALVKAATSQTVLVFIQDSASTTGGGKTGLAFNTASLTAYYARPRAAAVAITLATQTVAGAFSSGGFVEVDAANMPGIYRLDLPDAALASGVDSVVVMLKGAAGMAPLALEIQLTDVNFNDGVRAGLTALPNAAAGANGGVPTGNASGHVTIADASLVTAKLGTFVLAKTTNITGFNDLTQANVATGVWDAGVGAYGAPGSYGDLVETNLNATVSSRLATAGYTAPDNTRPANFTALSITAGGLVDVTQTAADKAWGTAARVLTAGTNIVLAKGTGVTGFTDLDAAGVAGAVWNAATVTYGLAGSYGELVETNLNATVSSRSTYAGGDTAGTTTLLARVPGTVQPQTGDAFARLGAPAGASNAADVAGILAEVQKVPRSGSTYKHTNTVSAATATVTVGPP